MESNLFFPGEIFKCTVEFDSLMLRLGFSQLLYTQVRLVYSSMSQHVWTTIASSYATRKGEGKEGERSGVEGRGQEGSSVLKLVWGILHIPLGDS